jgi:hypothetical protein
MRLIIEDLLSKVPPGSTNWRWASRIAAASPETLPKKVHGVLRMFPKDLQNIGRDVSCRE